MISPSWVSSAGFGAVRFTVPVDVVLGMTSSFVRLRKLFLDLTRRFSSFWVCKGYRGSLIYFFISASTATFLLICSGAIPARAYIFAKGVGFRQPVTSLHVSFRMTSTV